MTLKDKEMAIAEMLGAVKENWYPPNKDAGTTGDYYVFPNFLYEYKSGLEKKQYKWYPDNVRQHGDSALKFFTDANWQRNAIKFITNMGYRFEIEQDAIFSRVVISLPSIAVPVTARVAVKITEESDVAVPEALYRFSQYLKNL